MQGGLSHALEPCTNQLRDALAELYPDVVDARRVATLTRNRMRRAYRDWPSSDGTEGR